MDSIFEHVPALLLSPPFDEIPDSPDSPTLEQASQAFGPSPIVRIELHGPGPVSWKIFIDAVTIGQDYSVLVKGQDKSIESATLFM